MVHTSNPVPPQFTIIAVSEIKLSNLSENNLWRVKSPALMADFSDPLLCGTLSLLELSSVPRDCDHIDNRS